MKVQVKDKQGIDQAGNKHLAPGIADGTHECELKEQWKARYGDWIYFKKGWDRHDYEFRGHITRQIWVLAEQEKEGDKQQGIIPEPIKTGTDAFLSTGYRPNDDYKAFMMGWNAHTSISSTRIAELQARVAELEGVLKDGGWISVETALPDELKDVLFYNSGYKLCFIGRLYDKYEKTFWDQNADTHTKVTHWMPLPEKPIAISH